MANITQILGTDSVSSSRVVINDNFVAINSDISDIQSLLNTTDESISLVGAAAFGGLNISSGKVIINQSSFIATVPSSINAKLTLGAGFNLSVRNITTGDLPANNSYVHGIYKIDGTTVSSVNLGTGDQGQEIFLIAENANVTVSIVNIAGVTGLTINPNGCVSLKYAGSKWFISGSRGATIV